MGEVGRVPGGERGEWNPALFDRFRRARGERRRALAGQIIAQNEPLLIRLTNQLRGAPDDAKAFAVRFRGRSFARVLESEKLDWEEALNAARLALAKALERFDPVRGSLPNYLKKKIFYELQALVGKAGIVTVERGKRAARAMTFEDVDHMDRVLAGVAELEGEAAYMSPELEELEPDSSPTPFDTPSEPPPLPRDTRSALEVLLEEHLTFGRHARGIERAIRGRFFDVAHARGEFARHEDLSELLRARDVRRVTMRVPWSERPVQGLAGVALTIAPRPAILQRASCTPSAETVAISAGS